MPYFTDSSGNIEHASPGLLKKGELEKRGLRLLSDAEAKKRLAKGQPERKPAAELVQPEVEDVEDVAPAGDEQEDGGPDLDEAAQQQYDEICAEIDAVPNDAAGKDRLEEIGREYDLELDRRKNVAALRNQLKTHIAETLGITA